jgi:hypothetical protein
MKILKFTISFFFVFLSLISVTSLKISAKFLLSADENTGVSGTIGPNIPEPLHIDLVRPLGAKKGELEFNTLGIINLGRDEFSTWGPEIEYAFADGYAVEIELPFENENLEELKLAFQGTISRSTDRKFIHGWQSIHKAKLDRPYFQNDFMYVHGYKFNKKWSTLSLTGLRQNIFNNQYGTSLLNNSSLFRNINRKMKLGLETNWRIDNIGFNKSENIIALIPQIHYELGDKYSVQWGAGFSRSNKEIKPLVAIRVIWEL